MSINYFTLNSDMTRSAFKRESLVSGKLCNDYEFTGAKTVKILTPITVPMNNYRKAGNNRYGSPVEMQDIIQELTLTQDRSFALTIDKGNDGDQGYAKNAGKMLLLQIAERAVPEFDKYVLNKLANKAGHINADDTAVTKENICDKISEATAILDDNEVPAYDRMLFISTQGYKLLKHSNEFMAVESLGKEALSKGVIGMYDNMQVIKVPAPRWPANVNFMIVHKNAATAPVKMSETKLHKDPPGISGSLLEGREYYDCFVFAPRAAGVYTDVNTADGGVVCAKPVISRAGDITCGTSGAKIYYTTDGTDPRYSTTVVQGAKAATATGTTVKAYAHLDGAFDSAVCEKTF